MHPLALLLLSASSTAFAHDGHGLGAGSHWHASDAWGYLAFAVMVALALWAVRKK
jgi:hypothetical protein